MRKRRLATYAATFLGNFAVIGFGLWLFEGKPGTAVLSLLALVAGGIITWRAQE
jgi:hypothetical protein